ncbi:MAG: hypothetical protein HY824_05175 [Acidobacteria bacterium]|nr:hypothetical protein [Acidobacteriota bacterium]
MNITLVLKQKNYARVFAGTVRELAARGHHVRVLWQDADTEVPSELEHDNITVGPAPTRRRDDWAPQSSVIRRAADYVRYLEGPYRGAAKLRARAFEKMFRSLSRFAPPPGWSEGPLALGPAEIERLKELFRGLEQHIPSDPTIEAVLAEGRPDAVLVSPLIDLGSSQADFVKSARALGVPVGALVFSWDNLSTKGSLHVRPDRLFVWNERQRREAAELHGCAPGDVVVTGAPRFDDFFAQQPTLTREEFCAPIGFDPARPILMYVCSSKFVSPAETAFIERWIDAIRRSGAAPLRDCHILVRPHPDVMIDEAEGPAVHFRWPRIRQKAWLTRPFSDAGSAVVRTSYGLPEGFYECLFHSAAVIGLNTSAEIEAGIAGRPVLTVKADDDVVDGQVGTLHFHYLLEENGGFVRYARSLDEHLRQLAATLAGGGPDPARIQAFVHEFVRPGGADRTASAVLAEAIEQFAAQPAAAAP